VKDRQQKILRWVAEDLDISQFAPVNTQDPPPPPPGSNLPDPARTTDLRSFVASKSPKSDMQFAAVAAYFYRFEAAPADRRETISAENLQDASRLANWPRMSRPRNTLNNAKAQGYLDSVGRGQYGINSVGENLVAMTLPGADPASAAGRARITKARPKTRKSNSPKKPAQGSQKKVLPKKKQQQ
jgi:hypothetical protein